MEKLKNMLPYLIMNTVIFYLFPLLMKDTGSGKIILLIIIPLLCFMISYIYGLKNSFSWIYPLCIALMFTPSILLFYNNSATIYIFIYTLISVIGSLLGKLCSRK